MGLLSEEVNVRLVGSTVKYYENLGYSIPLKDNGKYDFNSNIIVKVEDLKPYSDINVKVKCDNCGKKYEIKYSDYSKHNHNGLIYCKSCACHVLCSGENSPFYKKELTDEERMKSKNRFGDENHTTWSKKVLARDKYTCQKCGKSNDRLMAAHHIDSYDWCKEKRTDLTNGITLCENCHKNFHSLYGYGQNTRAQFEEWFDRPFDDILKEFDGEIPTMRPIICLETKERITNLLDYCKEHNYSKTHIWGCCNNKSKAYDKHYMYYNDYIKLNEDEVENIIKDYFSIYKGRRKIVKLDLDNNILAVYNSISDAKILNKIKYRDGLYYCCMHEYSKSHGYKWEWFSYYCDNINTTSKPSEILNKYLTEIERN